MREIADIRAKINHVIQLTAQISQSVKALIASHSQNTNINESST